jgi:hypothetical protein
MPTDDIVAKILSSYAAALEQMKDVESLRAHLAERDAVLWARSRRAISESKALLSEADKLVH